MLPATTDPNEDRHLGTFKFFVAHDYCQDLEKKTAQTSLAYAVEYCIAIMGWFQRAG